MARVVGALFSYQAWGTLGKAISFRRGRSGIAVIPYRTTKVPGTAGQLAQQASFQSAISAWGALPGASKIRYNQMAEGTKLSGYHLFVQNYLLGG